MLNHDDAPIIRLRNTRKSLPREDRSKPKGKRPWRDGHSNRRTFFFEQ